MGYPVNVAARIQDLTKKLNNNFIISNDIYQFLDDQPICQISEERLKGIESIFKLYQIGEPFQYQNQ